MKRPKVDRRTEVTTKPCGCCGTQAILTLSASGAGAPVTLCAECIIALATALAKQH